MIIPIGHEDTSVRRLPWVTFTIMALCVLLFAATRPTASRHAREATIKLRAAVRYYLAHPYLDLDPRLRPYLSSGKEEVDASLREVVRQFGGKPPASERTRREQQRQLRELVDGAEAAIHAMPEYRFGLVPAHPTAFGLLAHMFMHAGWLHLLGNLFVLYLTGPFVEDAWGRPLFAGFYLASGIVAALMFTLHYPHFPGPLIGASGAIAGVMGAFLILFWNRRIKFFYWIGLVFHGTFTAPAWLMLGLWILRELVFAQGMDAVAAGSPGGGVAYWAHVWGFAFGAVTALGMRRLRIAEKYIEPAIESKVTLVDNRAIEEAMEAAREGKAEQALTMLEGEMRREPQNFELKMAYWTVCLDAGRSADGLRVAGELLRRAIREGEEDTAVAVWTDIVRTGNAHRVEPATVVAAAGLLARTSRVEEAREAIAGLAARRGEDLPPGPLVRAARIACEIGAPEASMLAGLIAGRADVPDEVKHELGALASAPPRVPPPPPPAGEAARPAVEPVGAVCHTLRIVQAVPVRLEAGALVVEAGGGRRRVGYDGIQAIAVAGIRDGAHPFIVVDLLLDGPWSDAAALRVVRLKSTSFDPRAIITGTHDDPQEALRVMLDELLRASEAVPLPDPQAAVGRPFAVFPSIEAYEREVLSASATGPRAEPT